MAPRDRTYVSASPMSELRAARNRFVDTAARSVASFRDVVRRDKEVCGIVEDACVWFRFLVVDGLEDFVSERYGDDAFVG